MRFAPFHREKRAYLSFVAGKRACTRKLHGRGSRRIASRFAAIKGASVPGPPLCFAPRPVLSTIPKLLGGYVHYPQLKLSDRLVPARNGFCFGSGISLTFKAKEHYGVRFFFDYNLLPSHSKNSNEYMNTLTLGTSFMITF